MRFVNIFQTKGSYSSRRQASYIRVPLLLSLFLSALFSATAYIDRAWADVPNIITLPDADSNGSPELSALLRDTVDANNYAYVMDASDGAHIKKLQFDSALDPLFQAVVSDVNGNGIPEIAMLGVRASDGKIQVAIKDSVNGTLIKNISFDKNFPPFAMAVVPDMNGNGADEIVVLGIRVSDGKIQVVVKDASDGAKIGTAFAFDKNFPPVAMVVVPDINGNGKSEIAVLGVRASDGKIQVTVKDASDGVKINGFSFDKNFPPVAMAVVPDMNGNGKAEIAVLGVRASDGKIQVVVKDASDGVKIGTAFAFDKNFPPVAMVVVPDINGNGKSEIAVLGVRASDGKSQLTVKDASDGVKINGFSFDKNFPPVSVVVVPDIDGGGSDEIAVLGVMNGSGEKKITIKDASSAELIASFLLPPYVSGTSGDISRLSLASDGTQGSGNSDYPSINSDGRYVAFRSAASNLVAGDTNAVSDIFVRDTINDTTTRVSVDSAGAQSNGASSYPSINSDGRYVVFRSAASNLVSGDTNAVPDIFMLDTLSGATTRLSVASNGTQGNGDSGDNNRGVAISDDGRYVAFVSVASNLVSSDRNGKSDVFVRDTVGNTTTRVSVGMGGMGTADGNGASEGGISISADGRYVAFRSAASNLVSDDTNGVYDIFVRDTVNDTTTRISVGTGGTYGMSGTEGMGWMQGNGNSGGSFISADGQYVSFKSVASNLVEGDSNGNSDIFVRDTVNGVTTRVSVASDGTQGDGDNGASSISSDGRYVAFKSYASNLVAGDTNIVPDTFVHDTQTGVTTRVSVAADGAQGNCDSHGISISSDGRYVTFKSYASNLVADDINGTWDIFHTTNPL